MQQRVDITGPKGYLIWLATHQPALYAKVRRKLAANLPVSQMAGFGADPLVAIGFDQSLVSDPVINAAPEGASTSWANTLADVLKTVAVGYGTKQQLDAQKELNRIQLERIRNGQQPLNIDPTSLGLSTASIGVGLTKGTQNLAIGLGAGLLAVMALSAMRRGRA